MGNFRLTTPPPCSKLATCTVKIKAVRGGNRAGAEAIGKVIADRLKEKGITQVVFDRGAYLYHGRIKALGDAAREGGLKF